MRDGEVYTPLMPLFHFFLLLLPPFFFLLFLGSCSAFLSFSFSFVLFWHLYQGFTQDVSSVVGAPWRMWCPDGIGRDSWDWVGPPAWWRACFNSPELEWRLLACENGASPDCIFVVVVVCRWLCGVVACLLLNGGLSSDAETSFGYPSEGHRYSCALV